MIEVSKALAKILKTVLYALYLFFKELNNKTKS